MQVVTSRCGVIVKMSAVPNISPQPMPDQFRNPPLWQNKGFPVLSILVVYIPLGKLQNLERL
jgi:hypothetical protein